jgi:hypothetical protein
MHHHTVEYASDYLVPGVTLPTGPGFHQITLAWDRSHPETGGTFHIDPNACGLDDFGNPTFCTKIAIANSDMKLTLVTEKPGHQAYTIETRPRGTTGGYTALPLRLVTIAAQGNAQPQVRLLVLNTNQTIERLIDLHQAPAA